MEDESICCAGNKFNTLVLEMNVLKTRVQISATYTTSYQPGFSLGFFRWCSTTWIVWYTVLIAMKCNYAPLGFKIKLCMQRAMARFATLKKKMHHRQYTTFALS